MELEDFVGKQFQPPHGCIQLVINAWRQVYGYPVPEDGVEHALELFRNRVSPVTVPKRGDIILTKKGDWHVGIVTGKKKMLHTLHDGTACIESYDGLEWKSIIKGFYQWDE